MFPWAGWLHRFLCPHWLIRPGADTHTHTLVYSSLPDRQSRHGLWKTAQLHTIHTPHFQLLVTNQVLLTPSGSAGITVWGPDRRDDHWLLACLFMFMCTTERSYSDSRIWKHLIEALILSAPLALPRVPASFYSFTLQVCVPQTLSSLPWNGRDHSWSPAGWVCLG